MYLIPGRVCMWFDYSPNESGEAVNERERRKEQPAEWARVG
jgi:hypothetical protein